VRVLAIDKRTSKGVVRVLAIDKRTGEGVVRVLAIDKRTAEGVVRVLPIDRNILHSRPRPLSQRSNYEQFHYATKQAAFSHGRFFVRKS
jgi:hypothetical protein